MAENTKIEWATHTFNPWIGCTAVSPACDHCYARDMMEVRYGRAVWGAGEDRVRTSDGYWKQPARWNKAALASGTWATVFCASLADVWDVEVDEIWRYQLMEQIEATQALTWLLLSKRIGNARRMTRVEGGHRPLPSNASLGATMVTQKEWDRDAGKLAESKAWGAPRFTFASVEPMLEPVSVREHTPDWVIVGGESGPGARDWDGFADAARAIRDECREIGAAFFMKQMPKKSSIPADLMIRELPRQLTGACDERVA